MLNPLRTFVIAIAILGANATWGNAAVLIENLPDDDVGPGWGSNVGRQQIVQEFSYATNYSISTVEWWGFFSGDAQHNSGTFRLELFTDVGGLPTTTAAVGVTTGVMVGAGTGLMNGLPFYKWSFSFAPIPLTAGTTYWLGIKGASTSRYFAWAHSSTDGTGDTIIRYADSDPWQVFPSQNRDSQAFRFSGTAEAKPVPEPSSLALLGVGGIGIAVSAFRRRRAHVI